MVMEVKKLSQDKMHLIDAQIAEIDKANRLKQERLATLEKTGFDFKSSSINDDLKLWLDAGKKLSKSDKENVLNGILEVGNISQNILCRMSNEFSTDERNQVLKALGNGKIDARSFFFGLNRREIYEMLFTDGKTDAYRERTLMLLTLMAQNKLDPYLFNEPEYLVCWQCAGKEILEGICKGYVPECSLKQVMPNEKFVLDVASVEYLAQRAFENKFSWYILLDILTSRKVYEAPEYYTKVMSLLAQTFSKGCLLKEYFEKVWVYYNFFSEDDWKKMYNSRIDFLVLGYLRKFYPDIKVKI